MPARNRARSLYKSQEEKGAVSTLLDCANTTLIKSNATHKKYQQEAICPWIYQQEKTKIQQKITASYKPITILKQKDRKLFRIKQWAAVEERPKQNALRKEEKKQKLQTISYESAFRNIINLSRELELFHIRRRHNYMQRQISLRFKTE